MRGIANFNETVLSVSKTWQERYMALGLEFGGTRMGDAPIIMRVSWEKDAIAIAIAFASTSAHILCHGYQLRGNLGTDVAVTSRASQELDGFGDWRALVGLRVKCKWLSLHFSPAGKPRSTHISYIWPIPIGPSRAGRVIHLFLIDMCRSLDMIGDPRRSGRFLFG